MKKFTAVLTKEVKLLICDGCGSQANTEDTEFHEFISVKHSCGYGSIHGDDNEITIDLCQHCFAGMCGDILTVTSNSTCDISDDIKNILSANEITNDKVLKTALKRVEQLWNAQYHSACLNDLDGNYIAQHAMSTVSNDIV